MMSPLYVLSAAVVLLSMPWASSASCLCSISGDPHITTCDTKTNFAWQGAGAYSLFKTPDTELQCDFDFPRYDNGSIIHQMFTYVSACRLSYKTPAGCEFTMLTGGNNDQQTIYVGNTKMTLSDVNSFVQKNLPAMGVNIDVDVPNAKTTCTMQSQQGPISFEMAPYQVHVTSASTSQCNGLCGTCDGKVPLALNLSDAASIRSYSTGFAADGSTPNLPIQLKPLPIGCVRNAATPSPANGTSALGQTQNPMLNATNAPSSAPGVSPSSAPGTTPASAPGVPASPSTTGNSPMPGSPSTPSSPGAMPSAGSPPSMAGTPSMGAPMPTPSTSGMPSATGSMTPAPSTGASPSGQTPTTSNGLPTQSQPSNPSGTNVPMPSSSPAPGSVADAAQTNNSSPLPSFPTPPATPMMLPNPQAINDNPVFESPDVLRKVIDQCLCGQPKSRYYKDAIFGRYFENCVYDKSFPGAEKLALSNMMTLHRAISKGFTSNNVSMAPLDMNVCRAKILQPAASKRPDLIPLDQGVSYIPIYTKQNSTGLPDLRPTIMTGTGEVIEECEVNPNTGSVMFGSQTPTSVWNRVQSPAPTPAFQGSSSGNSMGMSNGNMAAMMNGNMAAMTNGNMVSMINGNMLSMNTGNQTFNNAGVMAVMGVNQTNGNNMTNSTNSQAKVNLTSIA